MSEYRNPLTDYSPQMEGPVPYSRDGLESWPAPGVFTEGEELDLASRLLGVPGERELDNFVDGLVREAGRALNETLDPPMEQDLGSILKKIAKVALPIAGGAVGTFFGGPAGAMLGSTLGNAAGQAFGLELEGLSPEDAEFEVGKQFVRLAATIVQNAAEADPRADPRRVVHDAAVGAARVHAPGLIDLIERDTSNQRQYRRNPSSRGDHAVVHHLDRTQVGPSSEAYEYPGSGNGRGMGEQEQMDFAADLMNLETEEDFSNFLGGLISKGASAVGKAISSPTGQALGGVLKDAAKTLLPVAGQAVGDYFGGSAGGQIGSALGTAASNLFEAEGDEQEWEAANVFVKVAVDAVNNAADAHPGADPWAVAHHAVNEAIRRHAPHLMHPHRNGERHRRHEPHSGRWARHGRHIVVYGV
jgi:uncharacterized protein (DUF697 family)